jgi:hypothetical protein
MIACIPYLKRTMFLDLEQTSKEQQKIPY